MKIGKKKNIIDENVIKTAHTEMKKNVAKASRTKRFKRIYWMPAIALILIFCAFSPWIFTTGVSNQMENDFIWKSSLLPVRITSFNDLVPKKTKSITEISKLKNVPISSLTSLLNKETTAYNLDDEIIVLEEYSSYLGIDCYLYITNGDTNLFDFYLSTLRYPELYIVNNRRFFLEYDNEEEIHYLKLIEDFQYYFKIYTSETDKVGEILDIFGEN